MISTKRLGAVLLALGLVLGLGACGDDDDSGSDGEDTSVDNGDNGDNGDDTTPDDNGSNGDVAQDLTESMIATGLSEQQAECSVQALTAELNDEELAQLVTLTTSEGQDFTEDQLALVEAAFRAAGGCGVDIFGGGLGGPTTSGG
jgi:hypothetical protein